MFLKILAESDVALLIIVSDNSGLISFQVIWLVFLDLLLIIVHKTVENEPQLFISLCLSYPIYKMKALMMLKIF